MRDRLLFWWDLARLPWVLARAMPVLVSTWWSNLPEDVRAAWFRSIVTHLFAASLGIILGLCVGYFLFGAF